MVDAGGLVDLGVGHLADGWSPWDACSFEVVEDGGSVEVVLGDELRH